MEAVRDVIVEAFRLAPRGTAAEIARELDVVPQTVSKWRSGEVTPSPEHWPRLEQLLRLNDGALSSAHLGVGDVVFTAPDGRQVVIELKRSSEVERIPQPVVDRLHRLEVELRQLRDELGALRIEVEQLGAAPRRPARSSGRAGKARRPTLRE